jgi:hypothetical protein
MSTCVSSNARLDRLKGIRQAPVEDAERRARYRASSNAHQAIGDGVLQVPLAATVGSLDAIRIRALDGHDLNADRGVRLRSQARPMMLVPPLAGPVPGVGRRPGAGASLVSRRTLRDRSGDRTSRPQFWTRTVRPVCSHAPRGRRCGETGGGCCTRTTPPQAQGSSRRLLTVTAVAGSAVFGIPGAVAAADDAYNVDTLNITTTRPTAPPHTRRHTGRRWAPVQDREVRVDGRVVGIGELLRTAAARTAGKGVSEVDGQNALGCRSL